MIKNNELMLDVGQANELKLAFRSAGWTNADIKQLCEGNLLSELLHVIKGQAKIEMLKHLIDCSANPIIPSGYDWKVEYHDVGLGQLELDLSKIELYLSKKQQGSNCVEGNKLRKELQGVKNKHVLNYNVLYYLLQHPKIIPDNWKNKHVFFWGTIYRNLDGFLYVCCLCWENFVRWHGGSRRIDDGWNHVHPAAVLVS